MINNITIAENDNMQSIAFAGDSYRILLSGEQTGGNYAVIDMLVPPGGGPAPHAHKDMQEMFYIVEGEVEFKKEGGSYIAKKGSLVNIPLGGAVHCFKNNTDKAVHLICTVIPAGLDSFFKELGKPVEAGVFVEPPVLNANELKHIQSIAEKYGQQIYPPDYFDK